MGNRVAASLLLTLPTIGGMMMVNLRTVQYCRWAEPTLFVVHPYWTDAEAFPWSCHADGPPRPVDDTNKCSDCGRWQPKDVLERSFAKGSL